MSILFESDGRGPTPTRLFLQGFGALVVAALLLGALVAKTGGAFDDTFDVTATLAEVGDGLPARSDVKFRGVLVGTVQSVDAATGDGPNVVHMALDPIHAQSIPSTVTARVVPSNVFAVSSVQLIDNGAAPPLPANAQIPQDESLATVQLQTALTKLREIAAATARVGTEQTLGVLAAVAEATDRRGDDIVEAGAQLERIVREIGTVVEPGGGPSTLDALTGAVAGLHESAPELLDALHHSIAPMRTLAEKDAALSAFLFSGANTLGTIETAFANNTDRMIGLTTQLEPVLGVLADGSPSFSQIVISMDSITRKWFQTFQPDGQLNGVGKFVFQLTPHRMYTRADCPRYGELAGASCETAPTGAPAVPGYTPDSTMVSSRPMGGNVGPVGSPDEKDLLGAILGGDLNSAAEMLLGPLARGAVVNVLPEGEAPR
ncbi:MlaD family protein [Rhodococcus phenolicus]|uniref:MlaD family protein n=1 Tax=Rhodococcus phenolicus TaxID=263849 RepID=UPI00083668AB|nr:MCE family protein [Rhodococcus phenolicus]